MKNSKKPGGKKQITIAKNKRISMTSQPIPVSPSRISSSPSPSSPLSSQGLSQIDVPHAMRLDLDKIKTDDLGTDNTLAEYDVKLIIKEIRTLRYEQRQMSAAIKKVQDTLDVVLTTRVGQIQTPVETFETKYKLNLPLDTFEKFMELDKKIHEDAECRTFFIQMLSQKFDNDKTLTKNITALLKKCITKDVALLFNAQKKAEGKFLFKNTNFSNCLLHIIDEKSACRLIPPISDKNYLISLGTVLSNVRDWDIPRLRPSKQNHQLMN